MSATRKHRPAEPAAARPGAEEPDPSAVQTADPNPPWYENTWGGAPHYECAVCPYDTFDPDAIREHVRVAHNAAT